MLIILTALCALAALAIWVRTWKVWGKLASGERLKRMQASPHFRKGSFQNISLTPNLTEGASMIGVMADFLWGKHPHKKPIDTIPSTKTVLKDLPINEPALVWFGHSSYYMQLDGKRFLVDPVFSGHASPLRGATKSFKGSDIYTAEDMPPIDYLIITHDHYDHLDYPTMMQLKTKIATIVCGLGVGAHFERWGFPLASIIEEDWNTTIQLEPGFKLHTTPARHFSGRGLKRNQSLWMSYVLCTPHLKIFIGGDSGYDTHFKEIGAAWGPFDLAILEAGQYHQNWKYIHMQPAETLQAAIDLKAETFLPVHSSKFSLATHPWNEPLQTLLSLQQITGPQMLTPTIGAVVHPGSSHQFTAWWKEIR